MRMQFDWSETDMYLEEQHPKKIPLSVVCTSHVLLADCELNLFEQRRSESLLMAPTLAIERVLATLRLLDILDESLRRSSGCTAGNVFNKRADKVRTLVDVCSLDRRNSGSREVQVRPAYQIANAIDTGSGVNKHAPASRFSSGHGQANAEYASAELDAAIAMSNMGNVPMICGFQEYQRAQASGALCVRFPWFQASNGQSTAGMGHS